jgi:hypothetical protein
MLSKIGKQSGRRGHKSSSARNERRTEKIEVGVLVSTNVVSLPCVQTEGQRWFEHELTVLRFAAITLLATGLELESDSGRTDEGDPWFAFFDADSGKEFAHFARIRGKCVVYAPCLNRSLTARFLPELVDSFLQRYLHGSEGSEPIKVKRKRRRRR